MICSQYVAVRVVGDHVETDGHTGLGYGLQRAVGQDDARGVGGRRQPAVGRYSGYDAGVLHERVRNYNDGVGGQRQVSRGHVGRRGVVVVVVVVVNVVVGHWRTRRGRLDHVPRVTVMRFVRLIRAQIGKSDITVLTVAVHHRLVSSRGVRLERRRLHGHRRYGMHSHVPVQANLKIR